MAIPTRKSLWEQILDLLRPPSQSTDQSQLQSTAQQNQQEIKKNYNARNALVNIISLTNPLGAKSLEEISLAQANILNKQANELFRKATETSDKEEKSRLLRQSMELSQRASSLSQRTQAETPSTVSGASFITGFPGLHLIRQLPQYEGVQEQISKNIIQSYKEKYPQYYVPEIYPIQTQERLYHQILAQDIEKKEGQPTLPEGYKEPMTFTGQLAESFKQFFYQNIKAGIPATLQFLARDLNMPKLSVKLGEISAHADAYAKKRIDLEAPKEFQDWSSLLNTIKSDPLKYAPAVLGRFFGMVLPYTFSTLVATLAGGPLAGNAAIYAVGRGNFEKELLNDGVDPEKASIAAHTYGIISALIESEPFGGYTPAGLAKWLTSPSTKNILKSGLKEFLRQMPKVLFKASYHAMFEGGEEVVQDIAGDVIKWWVKDKSFKFHTLPQLAYSFLGGYIGALPLGITQLQSQPSKTPVGLSLENISENLPDNIVELIGKKDANGSIIKDITPAPEGYKATIQLPSGRQIERIINAENLDVIRQQYNPPVVRQMSSIQSQIAKLYRQLDNAKSEVEKAAIQSKIDKLQGQINQVPTKAKSEVKPEVKPEVNLIPASPKVGETFTAKILKTGEEYTGTVKKIAKMRTGAVMAQLETEDGITKWIPISKYAEWYKPETQPIQEQTPKEIQTTPIETEIQPQTQPITPIEQQPSISINDLIEQAQLVNSPEELRDIIISSGKAEQVNNTLAQAGYKDLADFWNKIKGTPPEQPSVPTQISEGEKIVATSKKLGGEVPYTPVTVKERLDRVKTWIENTPDAIKQIEKGILPEGVDPADIAAYTFQSNDPQLIAVVANQPDIMGAIHKYGAGLQILSATEEGPIKTTEQAIKEIIRNQNENAQELLGTKNLGETAEKVITLTNDLTNEVKEVRDANISKSIPNFKSILEKEGITSDTFLGLPNEEKLSILTKYYGENAVKVWQSFNRMLTNPNTLIDGLDTAFERWSKRQKIPLPSEAKEKVKTQLAEQSDKLLSTDIKSILQTAVKKAVGLDITPEDVVEINQYTQTIKKALEGFDIQKEEWIDQNAKQQFARTYYDLRTKIHELSNPLDAKTKYLIELRLAAKESLFRLAGKLLQIAGTNLNDIFMFFKANLDRSLLGRQLQPLLYTLPKAWKEAAIFNLKAFKDNPEALYAAAYMNFYSDPNFVMGRLNNLLPSTFEEMPSVQLFEKLSQKKGGIILKPFLRSSAAFETGYVEGLRLYADYVYQVKKAQGYDINDKELIRKVQYYTKSFLMQSPIGNSKFWQAYKFIAWAAGLTKSTFEHIGYLFGGGPAELRDISLRHAWQAEFGAFAMTMLLALILGRKKVEFDPRKASLEGIYISPTKEDYIVVNPYTSAYVLTTRMLLHIYNTFNPTGAIPNYVSVITGKETNTALQKGFNKDMLNILVDFAEGKSQPMMRLFIDFLKNEAYGGEKLTLGTAFKEGVAPISPTNFWDTWRNTEAGRRYFALQTALADYWGLRGNSIIRTLKWNYEFTKELARLRDAGQTPIQTLYHLGFMPANQSLTARENQIIFDYITNVVNERGVPFIQSDVYQNLPDDKKAKALAKSLDDVREEAYLYLMYNQFKNATPQQLEKLAVRYYKAGLFTSNRFKKMLPLISPEMKQSLLDIINTKILPLENRT